MTTAKRVPLFLNHPSSSLCFVIVGKVTKHNQDYNPIHDFVMRQTQIRILSLLP